MKYPHVPLAIKPVPHRLGISTSNSSRDLPKFELLSSTDTDEGENDVGINLPVMNQMASTQSFLFKLSQIILLLIGICQKSKLSYWDLGSINLTY